MEFEEFRSHPNPSPLILAIGQVVGALCDFNLNKKKIYKWKEI